MAYQFSAAELADMRTAQTGHMLDTGNIQPVSASTDTFGQVVETWPTNSADLAVGLDMRPGTERIGADMTLTEYDAILRMPITAAPSVRDRIRITKRFTETLSTALVFEIVGPIQRGPSGIRILLRRVET